MTQFSRRGLFQLTGGALALGALASGGLLQSAHAEAVHAGSTWLGTAPDASDPKIVAKSGHRISTLALHQGLLYYGYGDYGTNSGSQSGLGTNVSAFNPASGEFEVKLPAYNTEQIMVYREWSGKLYTPAIDPHWGSASFASNRKGEWAKARGIGDGEHIYDIAEGPNGELFMCGSSGGGAWTIATIWRSLDGGESWEKWYQEAPEADEYRDGYERFYWMGVLGTKIYVQADNGSKFAKRAPMRAIDMVTKTVSTISTKKMETGWTIMWPGGDSARQTVGDIPKSGAGVCAYNGELYFAGGSTVYAFNGGKVRSAGNGHYMSYTDKGDLLVSGQYGATLHQGTTMTSLASDVTGPAVLVGDQLYHASGSDLFVRTVTVPAGGSTGGGKADNPNKGKGKGKKQGEAVT